MAAASFLSNIWPKSPLSSFSQSTISILPGLRMDEEFSKEGAQSDKCELRVEGMTCGACVEVRRACFTSLLLTDLNTRRLRECSEIRKASIR